MVQNKVYSYFDGNPSLRILFVFDPMGAILTELENLSWKDGYRLVVFQGDWFTVKYALANDWKDEKIILVFQGKSEPKNQTSISKFPLYGEMKANMVYSEENYVTFMQLRGIKTDFPPYVARHVAEMQLSKYDKILADYYKPGVFSVDICNRGLLSGYMGATKLLPWEEIIVRLVCLCDPDSDTGKRDAFFRLLKNNVDATRALDDKLTGISGYPMDKMSDVRLKKFAENRRCKAFTATFIKEG